MTYRKADLQELEEYLSQKAIDYYQGDNSDPYYIKYAKEQAGRYTNWIVEWINTNTEKPEKDEKSSTHHPQDWQ